MTNNIKYVFVANNPNVIIEKIYSVDNGMQKHSIVNLSVILEVKNQQELNQENQLKRVFIVQSRTTIARAKKSFLKSTTCFMAQTKLPSQAGGQDTRRSGLQHSWTLFQWRFNFVHLKDALPKQFNAKSGDLLGYIGSVTSNNCVINRQNLFNSSISVMCDANKVRNIGGSWHRWNVQLTLNLTVYRTLNFWLLTFFILGAVLHFLLDWGHILRFVYA